MQNIVNALNRIVEVLKTFVLPPTFGGISVQDNAVATTFGGTGKGNKSQITVFDTNDSNNNTTPDHTNDHIVITKAGSYLVVVSIGASTSAGGSDDYGFSLWKNNGATEFSNVHNHRQFQGGGGDRGGFPMAGIINVAVGDTLEVWTWNEDNTESLVFDDITLSIHRVGD